MSFNRNKTIDNRMKEGSNSKALALVDNNAKEFEFHNSLQELKNLSCQLYHAADYCEKTFLNAPHKTLIVETTKEYISRAVVTIVDHLGSISTNLECCIFNTNSIPETTQHRIHTLNQRIMTCQQYSHKLTPSRFHWGAEFSRFHCRYTALPKPLTHSAVKNAVSRDSEAKSEKDNPFETEEPLFLYTYNCKPCLVHRGILPPAKNTLEDNKNLLPVRDGVSKLPRTVHSAFRFQEDQKLKRSTRNWKVVMQNKDINSLIRRGKRILS